MAKRKTNATKKQGGASEPTDSVQRQTTRRSSPGKASTLSPGSLQRSRPIVVLEKSAVPPGPAAAMNKGDDATGSPGHSQVKKRAPGTTAGKRGRAAANAPAEKTSESPSRSKPAVEDVTTAEPPVKTAKRGRAARGPTAKRAAAASASGSGQKTSESPSRSASTKTSSSRSKTAGVDSPAVATEKQPAKTGKRGRAPTRQVDEQPAAQSQHVEVDLAKTAGSNAGSPVRSPSTPVKRAGALASKSAGTSTRKQLPKRGRASTGKAALQQQVRHDSPAGPSKAGGKGSESQSPPQPKRKSLGHPKQPVVTANAGRHVDAPDGTAENSPKLTKGTKRGHASAAIDATASESQRTEEQGPPAKRAMASASADGKKTGTTALGAKRAGRPAKQPNSAAMPSPATVKTAGAVDGNSGRRAKKQPVKAQTTAPKSPGKQNKKLPSSSQIMASSSGAGKQKTASKGRQQPKPKRGKRKGADDLSDISDSSYVVPRGLLQRAKRREPFYYDYIVPWVESQLASEFDSSDDEDVSCASIDSIIPPAGMLQPYRRKNRLIGAGGSRCGSSSEDDTSLSPGEDLLSRCEAKFGLDTLPHSTTTTAEAISMLVNFASSRQLRFGALSELVTIVNKLFAPAKDVLPAGKALARALSEMP
uniref:Uncharacterized protein n=1 Tax=Rhipicephalus zambeziensis TaxID=60191 RepID=A0A224Z1N0_9ACAR